MALRVPLIFVWLANYQLFVYLVDTSSTAFIF
jgi:hypothetical protein